ncbi:hypothetical protein KAJ89_01370 [Candidatus Parcubacteria bacterium]|nr:hypothetical protein [Candidatus Parcubacteria bacterium]
MAEKDLYKELGVDAAKKSVRKAFTRRVDNDYPGAFVNIIIDPDDSRYGKTQHNDGDGSKFVQRLLIFQETGNIEVVRGAVDDAWEMNMGDIAASGFVFGTIMVTDVINIKDIEDKVPKDEIMEQVAIRMAELRDLYRSYGFNIYWLGGETADLPDQVHSIVFDVCVNARALRKDIVIGNVQDNDKIFGFVSTGQATWENEINSGLMSNGATLGRTYLMRKVYTEKYPFLIRPEGSYKGRFLVGECDDGLSGMSVSDALISPTRHWSILIRLLLEKLREKGISHMLHGISMNTGGGATKIGHVGSGILYKKKMPAPPELFQLIQRESGSDWEKMFRDFNCGIGIDIVGEDNLEFETALYELANDTNIACLELGVCEERDKGDNKVELDTPYGLFDNY